MSKVVAHRVIAILTISLLSIIVHGIVVPPSDCVEKNPLPKPPKPKYPIKGTLCGTRGDVEGDPNFIAYTDPVPVRNIGECRDLLYARHRTKSQYSSPGLFKFNNTDKLCRLYGTEFFPHIVFNEDSDTEIWQYECYICPDPCPQQVGTNLLQNGGFEAADDVIGPWVVEDKQAIVKPGNYSPNALSLYCLDEDFDICLGPYQDVNLCQDTPYYLQFNFIYVTTKGRGKRSFYFDTSDGWYARDHETPRNVWLREGHYVGNDNTGLIGLFASGIGFDAGYDHKRGDHFAIDNVQFVPLPEEFPTVPGALSIVSNGDFEDGTTKPWKIFTEATFFSFDVVSPGINSNYALQYFVPRKNGDSPSYPTIIQTVETVPRRQYVITLDLQFNSVQEQINKVWLSLGPIIENDYNRGYQFFKRGTKHQIIFTAPTRQTDIKLAFYLKGTNASLIVDNIEIKEFAGLPALQ